MQPQCLDRRQNVSRCTSNVEDWVAAHNIAFSSHDQSLAGSRCFSKFRTSNPVSVRRTSNVRGGRTPSKSGLQSSKIIVFSRNLSVEAAADEVSMVIPVKL